MAIQVFVLGLTEVLTPALSVFISIRTIFTKTERHTYVDPDYAYDEEELADVMAHKNKYNDYLKDNRGKESQQTQS